MREQAPGTDQVGQIARGLAGKHRVAGEAKILRVLDLGVPVRALYQAHHDAPALTRGLIRQPVDHGRGVLEVSLHRHAESFPARQRTVAIHRLEHIEHGIEPVRLLGVEGEADIVSARQLRELEYAWHQLGPGTFALREFEPRMQRREFYREARATDRIGRPGVLSDPLDRSAVDGVIFAGARCGARAFAKHVIGVAITAHQPFLRFVERGIDIGTEHELRAHDVHCQAHRGADRGLARATHCLAQHAPRRLGVILLQTDHLARQQQSPRRGVHEQRVPVANMRAPVAAAEFVADQAVGRNAIGNTQQGFRETHQHHAFAARQRIFREQRIDAGAVALFLADRLDQRSGPCRDRGTIAELSIGLRQQCRNARPFIAVRQCPYGPAQILIADGWQHQHVRVLCHSRPQIMTVIRDSKLFGCSLKS